MSRGMMAKILFVEDEESLVCTLTDALTSEGYEVTASGSGQEGYELARSRPFDLIILDISLPEKNGFDICRDLRAREIFTPILMLTARGELVDKVLGFRLGADDYLTKPFEIPELLVRIEALLRRTQAVSGSGASQVFDFGSIRVDLSRNEVLKDGHPVDLSSRELQLLQYFIEHPDQVIAREELLEKVWGYTGNVFTRTVDVHVSLLRKKLEGSSSKSTCFMTVRGVGYKFLPDCKGT
jgi:two-component system alkaline phosphatase synthesis response regulator PhoP